MTSTEQLTQARESGRYAPDLSELRKLLDYDPNTGVFRWKISVQRVKSGSVAGSLTAYGYIEIMVQRKRYLAHRLAWLFCHDRFPKDQIDHSNGVRTDNRISNLRECTHAENHQNRGISRNNTSGFTGVVWHKNRNKWKAQIKLKGKNHHLGLFKTQEEAYRSYLEAKSEFHKFQPAPRGPL